VPAPKEIAELELKLERAQRDAERALAELAQLRKWVAYLERSIDSFTNGLANGLREWNAALQQMSPLHGGNGESLVEPD